MKERTLDEVKQKIESTDRTLEKMKKEVITMPIGDPKRAYFEAKIEMMKEYRGRLVAEADALGLVKKE